MKTAIVDLPNGQKLINTDDDEDAIKDWIWRRVHAACIEFPNKPIQVMLAK